MFRFVPTLLALSTLIAFSFGSAADAPLLVGFGEADVTPQLGDKPVYLAGFGQNRKATAIHDPLKARAIVLKHGERKVALASVDVVGLFHASTERIRAALPGFDYVLVSSTHNHEGPDTLGLWGPNPFKSGLNPDYLKLLEAQVVQAVLDAEKSAVAVTARIGTAHAPELLHDGREPYIKHDELVVLEFSNAKSQQRAGLVVQWNCHPETLDSKNTEISADFVGYTVKELQERHRCPVVYLTGTVGGLMTSLHVPLRDADGRPLTDGTFAKTERHGRLVGQAASKALEQAKPLRLTPIQARSREVYLPLENKAYVLGWQLGVLQRQAYLWTGDAHKAEPAPAKEFKKPLCIRTEVAWLRLGELDIAALPGEIYPELVLDKVQDPADPNADFSEAPIEPAIYKQLAGPHRMLVGLANDEVGYILPKRQWDEKAPYCYGRAKAQYGEGNSVGPEAAPILCKAFQELVKK
ncbi:MAG: hypothetical protein JNM56_28150 [Planctomycetia bacterium]|nr:hypothetical protein [Planctomycetia bacterium]